MLDLDELVSKARWVRDETLRLHKHAPGTRLASSLSCVEIFVSLYYGDVLKFGKTDDPKRDRIIISKGHGSICLYPILADCGFFDLRELERIATPGSFLGTIPDTGIPGYESINGSLGLGLGVACGIAVALKRGGSSSKVFVVLGDGEMNEGAVWEAVMFAAFHKLDNMVVIIDDNKISMLDYQKNIMGLSPVADKLGAFGWDTVEVDGHDIEALITNLTALKERNGGAPKALIADTIKGKGVKDLETDVLCHVRSLSPERVEELLARREY